MNVADTERKKTNTIQPVVARVVRRYVPKPAQVRPAPYRCKLCGLYVSAPCNACIG